MELESLPAFDAYVAEHQTLSGVVVQGLDLRSREAVIVDLVCRGTVFLGCQLTDASLRAVFEKGAMIFPRIEHVPYHPYRGALYSVEELMAGYERGNRSSFEARTHDARIYADYQRSRSDGPPPIIDALAQRLHDQAIDDGLDDLLHGAEDRRVVGIMGGHALGRRDDAFARVVTIAKELTEAGYFVATGGGPGAMEAGNLGAYLAGHPAEAVDQAVGVLSAAQTYKDPAWFDSAYEVRDRFTVGAESLAIPTWFYGHEPSNLFATHIAKYFSNSLREDGLLALSTHGVIYAPGSAGTIQEIFMDAAQNHYGTFKVVSPMIFFGARYWTEDKPVFPVLQDLATGKQYADMLTITDDIGAAVEFIRQHPPVPYRG
ncbi:MAG: hypothetical protein AAGF12_03245 [Myxococcota bacterium]